MTIQEVLLDMFDRGSGVTIDVSKEDLEKIPKEGTFITVSNHPFGGLGWYRAGAFAV